jgi:hypothetical protein
MALQTGRSSTKYAILSAAAMVAAGIALPSPVRAADLGGNCCADLEERVAELEATTARKGNRKVSLTISGQVSTELLAWHDGGSTTSNSSDVFITDNTMAGGTYVAFTGDAKINPTLSAGFNITMAMCGGARSHHVNQNDDDAPQASCFPGGGGDSTFVTTLANWYLDSKDLGRVTVGRINTATAGLTTIDLGGAGVIANASIGYTQRGFFVVDESGALRTTTWSAMLGGNTVNGASLSRANAISYTSPNMAGFSVSAAWGENDIWDAAIRYAGESSGFRLAAGLGYTHNVGGLNEVTADIPDAVVTGGCNNGSTTGIACQPNQWKGSASIMHLATGLYLTGAFVNQSQEIASAPGKDMNDTRLYYVQGGISKNWTGLGNTTLYGEYANVNHGLQGDTSGSKFLPFTDSRANVWGLGVVQAIDAASMDVFLAYRRYSAELENVPGGGFGQNTLSVSDFGVVLGGARIKF